MQGARETSNAKRPAGAENMGNVEVASHKTLDDWLPWD